MTTERAVAWTVSVAEWGLLCMWKYNSSKMPRGNYSYFILEGELKVMLGTEGRWKAVAVSDRANVT